jgi:hypothetical protein
MTTTRDLRDWLLSWEYRVIRYWPGGDRVRNAQQELRELMAQLEPEKQEYWK